MVDVKQEGKEWDYTANEKRTECAQRSYPRRTDSMEGRTPQ